MKSKNERDYADRNRVRLAVYFLCLAAAMALTVGIGAYIVVFPLPERYTSVHPASTVPPLMGFSAESVFNTGDAKALDALPGIGEVISQRIVEGRELWGGYRLPTDLLLVKGIGEITLEKIMNALDEPLVELLPLGE